MSDDLCAGHLQSFVEVAQVLLRVSPVGEVMTEAGDITAVASVWDAVVEETGREARRVEVAHGAISHRAAVQRRSEWMRMGACRRATKAEVASVTLTLCLVAGQQASTAVLVSEEDRRQPLPSFSRQRKTMHPDRENDTRPGAE
jgi:hypothetical protein